MRDRKTFIGGTDAAAIIGVSPWRSPLDVWMEKVGMSEGTPDNWAMRAGRALEPVVRQYYRSQHPDRQVTEVTDTMIYTECETERRLGIDGEWAGATIDGAVFAPTGNRGLEIKTTSQRPDDWGDDIPMHYMAQVQWYAMVTGLKDWDVAVLFANRDYREFQVTRDDDLIAIMYDQCKKFWFDHVVAKVPPVEDASSDAKARYLKARYPQDGPALIKSVLADAAVENLRVARAALEAAKHGNEVAENDVKSIIGEAGGIDSEIGKVTWKKSRSSFTTDWESVARFDVEPPKEVVAKFTVEKPGSRRLVVPRNWK